jgi:hypothetical protein
MHGNVCFQPEYQLFDGRRATALVSALSTRIGEHDSLPKYVSRVLAKMFCSTKPQAGNYTCHAGW